MSFEPNTNNDLSSLARTAPGDYSDSTRDDYIPRWRSDPGAGGREPHARVELLILGIDLPEDSENLRKAGRKEILSSAVMRGIRRLVRPMSDVSVRAEGDSVGIVVGSREIDLGPEVLNWFVGALRSGSATSAVLEITLPLAWLRPAVAESALLEGHGDIAQN